MKRARNKMAKKKFDLNLYAHKLLMSEPFFAALSRRIDKQATSAIPTAGMRIEDDGFYTLLYNPDYLGKLTAAEISDVLKHEFYHLIFEHISTRLPKDCKDSVTMTWNIACDLAINSHLRNLPKEAMIPGGEGFEDLPAGLTAEQYHRELKKRNDQEKNGQGKPGQQKLEDMEGFDDHSGWGGEPASSSLAQERLKRMLEDSASEAQAKGSWGSVPESIKKKILANIGSTVDWRKLLRYFIKTSQKADKSTTVKKINKRYPYLHPGRKTNRQAQIAVSIDQSGSVNDSMLAAFFAELSKLAEFATFTVVPFDTEVNESLVFEWKKGQKLEHKRVLTGGTDFNAPTEYVNSKGFDGHIILTDMCAPKPKPSKCQRMWMTTEYHKKNQYFETQERVAVIKDV
jgi:predicted metal-dependent peptidase